MNTPFSVRPVSSFLKQNLVSVLALASLIVSVIALKLLGQPVSCRCGSWNPWSGNVWSTHNSQHLFDPYALTHVSHGILFCGVLWLLPQNVSASVRMLACVLIESAWEVFENTPFVIERYRTATMSLDYFGDSIINSIGDIVSCMAGYVLAVRLGFWKTTATFAVMELVLVFWIRDCLTLNVLMLLWPVEAIKVWQMAGAGL